MPTTLGIVEVRSSSPQFVRSPFSLASRRLGGKSLLQWLVQRVTEAQQLDQVIALVEEPHAASVSKLTPPNVPIFSSTEPDGLSSLLAAARAYSCDAVVRVRLGSPLIDPVMIDRLVVAAQLQPGTDYASYCSTDGKSAISSKLGVLAEWCRLDALERASAEAAAPRDRQDALRFIYSRPDLFRLRLVPLPTRLDCEDLRLAVQCEEDWEHVEAIFEALGPEGLDWQRIAELLDQQPDLRQRMARLNRWEETVSS